MCRMESLKEPGVIDLADIALLNDMIEMDSVNQEKVRRYFESKNKSAKR